MIPIGGIKDTYFGNSPVLAQMKDGRWCNSRPIPYDSLFNRVRHAWNVLIGRADALYWTIDTKEEKK